MRFGKLPAVALGATLLAVAGCMKGPSVPHPMEGQTRHLCCNVWYEKPKINDVLYQTGTKVPFGTRVQIVQVDSKTITFQPDGHPPITFVLRYGRKQTTTDEYLHRLFVPDDPRARLRRVPQKTVRNIEDGIVTEGMTREQVLMAVGFPPMHRTPSLEQDDWHFWENRWHEWIVRFDGDKVAGVRR
jgi:hypothetical protein